LTDVLSTSVTLRRCKLVRVSVDGSVAEYIFDQPDVTLGGHEDNDLVIDDPRVSRRHAQLRAEGERYYLFDLNATGGTFVNGLRNQVDRNVAGSNFQFGLHFGNAAADCTYGRNTARGNVGGPCPTGGTTDFCDEGANDSSFGDNFMPTLM